MIVNRYEFEHFPRKLTPLVFEKFVEKKIRDKIESEVGATFEVYFSDRKKFGEITIKIRIYISPMVAELCHNEGVSLGSKQFSSLVRSVSRGIIGRYMDQIFGEDVFFIAKNIVFKHRKITFDHDHHPENWEEDDWTFALELAREQIAHDKHEYDN